MGYHIDYKFCPQCRRPLTPSAAGDPHCDHCEITIYTNVSAAGCVFPVHDGKVMLARRAREPYKGDYDLVGGFMKPGETPQEAAQRESLEETGLAVKITELLGIYPDKYGDDGPAVMGIVYLAEIEHGQAKPKDDVASLEWVEIDNIPQRALDSGFNSVGQALRDLQAWHRSNH